MGRTMPRTPRRLIFLIVLAFSFLPGCRRAEPPAEEKAPPAAVKWQGPSQASLEEWTELVGTTVPLPDRLARVSAPVEGRVAAILGEGGEKPVAEGQRGEKGSV